MRVNPTGSKNAAICIVGEAPGMEEDLSGVPFIGASGRLLNQILTQAGIVRDSCYITYVVKDKPPLGELGISLDSCIAELKTELELINCNVIVALGNTALTALTGKTSITKWRGSILESTILPGRKVIPTIHPATAMRSMSDVPLMVADFVRVAKESQTTSFLSLKSRKTEVITDYNTAIAWLTHLLDIPTLSVDIETDMGASYIKCIGFAISDMSAICIPIVSNKKPVWLQEQEVEIWIAISKILVNKTSYKIIQNAQFELDVLHQLIGVISPIQIDTMIAQKLCYPELPKSLAVICSLYTTEPFYKDDAKDSNYESEALWRYNGLDCMVTFDAALSLQSELNDLRLSDFFHGYQMPLLMILNRASRIGIKIDNIQLSKYYEESSNKLIEKQTELNAIVGRPINVNSQPQVRTLLYKELGLAPVSANAGTSVSDEETLTRLAKQYPLNAPLLNLILEVRGIKKHLSNYLTNKSDPDGRVRTSWVIGGTETGRLSSRENYRGTGLNLQNVPKTIRNIFIADDGYSFVKGDLSQVEARYVAWLANDIGLKNIFKKGGDIHTQVAAWVHKIPVELVSPEQRQRTKHVVHGANYAIGPRTFSYKLGIKEADGKWLLNQFHSTFTGIKQWHNSIQKQLSINRTLISPFGRRRQFFGWWGDTMFREAYANIPQGCAADLINMALVRIYYQLPRHAELLLQVHDELVFQCLDKDIDTVAQLMKREIEIPILVNGDYLTTPVDIVVGKDWKNTTKWNGEHE